MDTEGFQISGIFCLRNSDPFQPLLQSFNAVNDAALFVRVAASFAIVALNMAWIATRMG